ncbi:hypothetical protein [Microvirga aerophila]|uniref:Uncharacterized protein n=1 Tax=Microvirga aerophila TaxID=670291 RepID=A0A512C2D0_9HYPH|nr:hypothetical protein [Microvirga aerophila]GEO18372.1 hypothetical protein MAE02_60680 [Microvirga aerophila]
MRIALFRAMADGRIDGVVFAHTYVSSNRKVNEDIRALSAQVFDPMMRELRRRIEWSARGVEEPSPVPASDRIVTINHNAPDFRELIDALDNVQQALRAINGGEPDEKGQLSAEIEAGRKLLDAPRTRIQALTATVGSALLWVAKRFADTAAGKAAEIAMDKLGKVIPAILDYLAKW